MSPRRTTFVVTLAFAVLWSSVAAAATMAGLQVEIGSSVDANVRADIVGSVAPTVKGTDSWGYIETSQARSAMNPVVRDCFTRDCLTKAGEATNADAGLRVRFSGESQIYDWTLEVFDLRDGEQLASRKGACELCGRSEVVREFRSSLRAVVEATAVPGKPVASEPTAKPPAADVSPKPSPTESETPPRGAGDPAAGLVMLEVSTVPDDAIIMLNGEELGVGAATVSLQEGSHELVFAREGYGGFKETFVVGPDTSRRAFMRVHLSKTDPDAVMVEPHEGPIDRLGRHRTTWGVVALAVGGGLLATGIILNHLDGRPTCGAGESRDCPTLYDTTPGAFVATFTGATFITAGVVLLTWELLAGKSETEGAALGPTWTGDGPGIGASVRF